MKKIIVALLLCSGISAQAKVLLGTTHLARHYTDNDVIVLRPAKCGLTKVQLNVTKRKADIEEIAVQYKVTGNWDFLPIRKNFKRGSSSRWIDLKGANGRCIKRIAVVGDSDGLPLRQAKITVYGK